MGDGDKRDGNHDIMEGVVLTRGRTVNIISTALTPNRYLPDVTCLLMTMAEAQTVSMQKLLLAHM